MEKEIIKSKNALEDMAQRLKVDADKLKATMKQTICKGTKRQDGSYIPLTDEEFVAFAVVANTYKLNPFIKEIYAYPDTKSKGIVPIVSTDGWNKLMTTHPDYKGHSYAFAEEMVTPVGGKPCPEWIEINIIKKDGSVITVREYLDECYRQLTYPSPWQTHTKRMLRHKTKIQGAREAFGFGGIYDHDEAERIIEAEVAPIAITNGKPEVSAPKEKKVEQNPPTLDGRTKMLEHFEMALAILGEKKYQDILKKHGFEQAIDVRDVNIGATILSEMRSTE